MTPILKFLLSLRNLQKSGVIKSVDEAYDFAKREFGEINDLFKRQIEQVFKTGKPTPKPGEGGITSIKNAPKKQEPGIETLKQMKQPGMDLTTGLTRTAVRKILDRAGIQVPDKVDAIEVFVKEFGGDVLIDVKNVAEEMIELERMGKSTKSMDEILEQSGLFDITRNPNARKGMSDEQLEQIKKEVDQDKMIKDFDPTDREPNSMGGFQRIGFADGPEDPKKKKGIMKLVKKIPKVGKTVESVTGIINAVKKLNKKFGKGTIKTADEIDRPQSAKDKEMFEKFEARNPDPKRKLTDEEIEMYEEELGDSETWMSEGTVEEAEQALKRQKEYEAAMYTDYKAGRLDPQPGEKGRKEFLEQKFDEMEMSGDKKLMTRDEIEELSTFDLGVELEAAKKAAKKASKIDDDIDISQGMIDLDEMNFTKNAQAAKKAIDNASIDTDLLKAKLMERFEPGSKPIKQGDPITSENFGESQFAPDTSDLEKAKKLAPKMVERFELKMKYPGIDEDFLTKIINDPDPQRKAEVLAVLDQSMLLVREGKSGDEIVDILKKETKDRKPNARGGLNYLMGM
jgi:hypothetical protein